MIYCSCFKGVFPLYFVFQVFPDGSMYLCFSSVDCFDCILYVHKHMFDNMVSKLVIV